MESSPSDPLAGSAWSAPGTVAGFATSAPNAELMRYAATQQAHGARRVLDIGCGAGRNAVPLCATGLQVTGIDLSAPMLAAAAARGSVVRLVQSAMGALPVQSGTIDLIIAHGIWNLARSQSEFRQAVSEAARVAAPGAALFVFTFSRNTLDRSAQPLTGETFVFTQFSGSPQVFLTEAQLVHELETAGFNPDPDLPVHELNLPPQGQLRFGGAPVIHEAGFRFTKG